MDAPATFVIVPVLVAEKFPGVWIDCRVVSASSNNVTFVPLAETSPRVTVPVLAIVTEPVFDRSETTPLMFNTSVAISANDISPNAFKFKVPAWILAPATSVIVAVLVAEKFPGVWMDARVVSASSNNVTLVPLAVTSPSVTDPGLAMVTEPVVDRSETTPLMFKISVALSANDINPTAFRFRVAAWILAPATSVIVPVLVAEKPPVV